ncbi:hypothetical protein [Methanosarcina barkeri]|uniref:hypothetical protein n=1 Tax=Methanosarcina barkeri TaxID=2208 RepID=UPI00003C6984|nr:hypothetical protein [Methanosarcina barkeri]
MNNLRELPLPELFTFWVSFEGEASWFIPFSFENKTLNPFPRKATIKSLLSFTVSSELAVTVI